MSSGVSERLIRDRQLPVRVVFCRSIRDIRDMELGVFITPNKSKQPIRPFLLSFIPLFPKGGMSYFYLSKRRICRSVVGVK